jgi:hypothetical protein
MGLVRRTPRPPISNIPIMSTGSAINFGRSTRPGCLIMSGKQYVGSVGAICTNTDSVIGYAFLFDTDAIETGGQFYLAPQNSAYFDTPLVTMVRMFERYRIISHSLTFVPLTGTNTPMSTVVAYFPDCQALEALGLTSSTQTPSQAMLHSSSNCSEFPMFSKFATRPVRNQGRKDDALLYVAGNQYDDSVDFSEKPADNRMNIAGVYGITYNGNLPDLFPVPPATSGQSITVYTQDVYMYYTVELCYMQLAITGGIVYSTRSHLKALIKEHKLKDSTPLKDVVDILESKVQKKKHGDNPRIDLLEGKITLLREKLQQLEVDHEHKEQYVDDFDLPPPPRLAREVTVASPTPSGKSSKSSSRK